MVKRSKTKRKAASKVKPLKSPRRTAKKRSNPEGEAAERYELFHGRPPAEVIDVTDKLHEHSVLSGIGLLISMTILAVDGQSRVELSGFKGAVLSQDEQGKQLFIRGGDQAVNLKDFGIRGPLHENEVLGAVQVVVYDTQKDHLGDEGGKAWFKHKFGGPGKRLPILGYRVRDKLLEFWGGGYDLPEVGIRG